MIQKLLALTIKKNEQVEILLLSLTLLILVIGLSQASQSIKDINYPQSSSTVGTFNSPEIGE